MNPSIVIIGPDTFNTQMLIEDVESRNIIVKKYAIADISFVINDMEDAEFFQYDIYIFRGYDESVIFTESIAIYLRTKGKIVIDNVLGLSYIPTKIHEAIEFALNNISHPKTVYARNIDQWRNILPQLPLPIVIKPEDSQKGQGVEKYETYDDALDFLHDNPKGFLAQEYIPLQFDIRVFIVGNIVLGAIKRNVIDGDFRTNASLGSVVEVYELSDNEKKVALQAHNVLGYDISGVDIILRGDDILVLEVNITPQWEAFQKVSSINVARHIIDYVLEKYENKNRIS